MTTIPVTNYVFNPSAATITFTDLSVVDPTRVAAIYDESVPFEGQEFGTVLYLAENALTASASGNVLTIPQEMIPPQAQATDTLKITYNIDAPDGWERLTFPSEAAFPATGSVDYIYLAADSGQLYEWDGAAFVAV